MYVSNLRLHRPAKGKPHFSFTLHVPLTAGELVIPRWRWWPMSNALRPPMHWERGRWIYEVKAPLAPLADAIAACVRRAVETLLEIEQATKPDDDTLRLIVERWPVIRRFIQNALKATEGQD